jgi:hypothetical protein
VRKLLWALVPAGALAGAALAPACSSTSDCTDLGTCGSDAGTGGKASSSTSSTTSTGTTGSTSSTGGSTSSGPGGSTSSGGGAGGSTSSGGGAGGSTSLGDAGVCVSKRWGDSSDQAAQGLLVDNSGNFVLAGSFQGQLNFGGSTLSAVGATYPGDAGTAGDAGDAGDAGTMTSVALPNTFATKLDPTSFKAQWSTSFPAQYLASAVDASGNVVIAAVYSGATLTLPGCTTLDPASNSFVAKLDGTTGACIFATQFPASPKSASLTVDMAGNILFAGGIDGVAAFGAANPPNTDGEDIFVVQLDSGGAYVWQTTFGSPNDDAATGVAVDASNDVYVTGTFNGLMDVGLGSNPLNSTVSNVFVLSLDTNGTPLWAQQLVSANTESAGGIAVTPSGVAVAGGYAKTIDIGGTMLTATTSGSGFASMLSPVDGSTVWAKSLSGTSVTAFGADTTGNMAYALTSASGILVIGLDPGGTVTFDEPITGTGSAASLAFAGTGTPVALAGSFTHKLGALQSAGGDDVFFLEVCP